MCSYTKLKEVDKLNEFVRSDVGWVFDVVTAITVCRQAGYFEHALYLAQKHLQHDLYIKVQLEDQNDSKAALTYIRHLSWQDADRFITKVTPLHTTHYTLYTTQHTHCAARTDPTVPPCIVVLSTASVL